MNIRQQIIEDCPLLYRKGIYFECQEGWMGLIYALSLNLEGMIQKEYENHEDCYAIQVKEKFGALRFYMCMCTEEMYKLIYEFEKISKTVCEICGKPGKTVTVKNWVCTRCEEHE